VRAHGILVVQGFVDDTDDRTKTFTGFPAVEGSVVGRDAQPLPVGRLLGGRFLVQAFLGEGGSGVVYAALDQRVGQRVALKVLRPELVDARHRERLRREVRSARHGHPNVVAVYDLHDLDGRLLLSMELVDGTSLRETLVASHYLEPGQVASIARQIAAALEHLHAHGLVHRDVKPGNIMVTRDGTAKLCDMGLARPVEQGITVTESQMVVGTPAYMAPEQATGAELTAASDVYSLGLTLFQCLTGEVPLTAPTAVSTLALRQRAAAPRVRRLAAGCPRWLDRLLRRMLDRDPAARPPATELVRLVTAERVPIRIRGRHLLAAAAIVALALAGVWAARSRPPGVDVVANVENGELHARSEDGRVLWKRRLVGSWHRLMRADLDRDGSPEIIVTAKQDEDLWRQGVERLASEVLVFQQDGRLLTSLRADRFIPDWTFPYRIDLTPTPYPLDLDGDGELELVVVCNHAHFYPSVVLAWWPRPDVWQSVIEHPGRVYQVGVPPAAGGDAQLMIAAFNNLLGMLPVLGVVRWEPPLQQARHPEQPLAVSPPHGRPDNLSGAPWRVYVPLEPSIAVHGTADDSELAWSRRADGGIDATLFGTDLSFDANFNPVPGPNEGRDLGQERLAFLSVVSGLQARSQPSTPAGVLEMVSSVESRCASVLAERPYRAILGIETARALARTGDPAAAATVLEATAEQAPFDDVKYRLASVLAVAGELDRAEAVARSIVERPLDATPRRYDAGHLVLRLAIERRDRAGRERLSSTFLTRGITDWQGSAAFFAALRARADLWWDELAPADTRVSSVAYEPAGDALAALARWRLGESAAGDVAAMERFAANQPDAVYEGRLALAAALLGAGQPERALESLEQLAAGLELAARDDFSNLQLLRLARAMHARALLAAGSRDDAREEAAELARALDPSLLPGILVAEVLRDTAPIR